jgi:acyl-CoA thioesterase I
MNPILLYFSDGTTYFVGLLLVVLAETIMLFLGSRIARPILTVATIMGIILAVISATPIPLWAYLFWIVPALIGLVLLNRKSSPRKLLIAANSVLLMTTLALCAYEARYRFCPKISIPEGTIVYVLGDSISAGLGTDERCWPTVLADLMRLRVVNLARPGAKVASAIVQAKDITAPNSLVIVEIGGNDLLGGTDASAFRGALNKLVTSLRANNHDVLLLELPLFPFKNAYGEAQRDIAAKHGAALLPKRYFSQVLGTENATLDGLHLSQAGHEAMARIIANVIAVK